MSLEIINPNHPRGPFRVALWDFDGTLSLYRGGWQDVMVDMMVDELLATGTREKKEDLHELVTEFVVALTGAPTIHQMIRLAEEVEQRAGRAREASEYGEAFHHRLLSVVNERIASVDNGLTQRHDHAVPGAPEFLRDLAKRGVTLVLASGTEKEHVVRELNALGLADYFGKHVYAPRDRQDMQFSKAKIIEQILAEVDVPGHAMLGIGDGTVETVEVKRVGGCTIGIASEERERIDIDPHKRKRLVASGADLIVPHFREREQLIVRLFPPEGA